MLFMLYGMMILSVSLANISSRRVLHFMVVPQRLTNVCLYTFFIQYYFFPNLMKTGQRFIFHWLFCDIINMSTWFFFPFYFYLYFTKSTRVILNLLNYVFFFFLISVRKDYSKAVKSAIVDHHIVWFVDWILCFTHLSSFLFI